MEVDGILQSVDLRQAGHDAADVAQVSQCYITSALRPRPAEGQQTEVMEFLRGRCRLRSSQYMPVGIGTTVRVGHPGSRKAGSPLSDRRLDSPVALCQLDAQPAEQGHAAAGSRGTRRARVAC